MVIRKSRSPCYIGGEREVTFSGWRAVMWKKAAILVLVVALLAGGAAVASWRLAEEDKTPEAEPSSESQGSFQERLQETLAPEGEVSPSVSESADAAEAPAEGAQSADSRTGEDFSYTSPGQRYVTETQRHQNFLRAVAEGRVTRLDVVSTDVRPVGDPNTSYVYFTLSTTDGGTSNGTMVMRFEDGMWRIAAVSQLRGDLGGGTDYRVPSSFEEELAREIAELQPFLTKVAEGRLDYLAVYSVSRPSENESVLTGVVAGVGGRMVPSEMRLRRDYGIWHITFITNPP